MSSVTSSPWGNLVTSLLSWPGRTWTCLRRKRPRGDNWHESQLSGAHLNQDKESEWDYGIGQADILLPWCWVVQKAIYYVGLPTLIYRRERGDMIEIWKHFNTYDPTTLTTNFKPIYRTTRCHDLKLTRNKANDGVRGTQTNSFYFRTASTWNSLPAAVVKAENIDTFKARLDKEWTNRPQKFTIDRTWAILRGFSVCELYQHDYYYYITWEVG